jgi:hypothetical protein
MIQFNLLPDVKLAFLKARRTKRLVIMISSLIAIVSLVIFIALLVYVDVVQKQHLNSLSSSISSEQRQLGSTGNLDKVLTIQNQLNALPNLDAQKPAVTRLFGDLIAVTPAAASISQLSITFTSPQGSANNDTLQIEGNADSLLTINQYVDTLKFTVYNDSDSTSPADPYAFTNVVLSSYGIQSTGDSFNISLNFNPAIFNIRDNKVTLHVPQETTTRSITQLPTDLFQKNPSSSNGGA